MAGASPASTYYQPREFTGDLGGELIRVVSKPGLPCWDAISPASHLLASVVQLDRSARVVLLGCGHGALGVLLARRAADGHVLLADPHFVAVTMAQRTLEANAVRSAAIDPNCEVAVEPGTVDAVVVVSPKERKLARRWLV